MLMHKRSFLSSLLLFMEIEEAGVVLYFARYGKFIT
jgi:hypothetical protein